MSPPADARIDLPKGALELAILQTLSQRSEHGYGILRAIQAQSREPLFVEEGSLYPALHRMERKGWIASEWGVSDSGRRAKYYRLEDEGRSELAARKKQWRRLSEGMARVLRLRPAQVRAREVGA